MVALRRYVDRLHRAERERTSILFTVATMIGMFVFAEMGRRQRLTESREDSRRVYVDTELAELHSIALEARARAEGAAEAEKARRERSDQGWQPWSRATTLIVTATTVLSLLVITIAYKLI